MNGKRVLGRKTKWGIIEGNGSLECGWGTAPSVEMDLSPSSQWIPANTGSVPLSWLVCGRRVWRAPEPWAGRSTVPRRCDPARGLVTPW